MAKNRKSFEDVCKEMVDSGGLKLSDLAHHSLYVEGMSNDSFVMVLAQWTPLLREFMREYLPEEDWDRAVGSSEEIVYMSGQFKFGICRRLCEYFPEQAEDLMKVPPPGQVKLVALTEDGFIVHYIIPSPLHAQ